MINISDKKLINDIRQLADRAQRSKEIRVHHVLASLASGTLPDSAVLDEKQLDIWLAWLANFNNPVAEDLSEFLESLVELRNKTRFA